MKLLKILTVAGQELEVIQDDVSLELSSPGRASFKVLADDSLSGRVTLDLGFSSDKNLKRWFTGYVEKSIKVSKTEQLIFCRELTAALNRIMPLSLRHPTIESLALSISMLSGLSFNLPDKPYTTQKIPYFYSVGGGYHALDSVGEVFQIPNYIWQQQGNGEVYLGAWDDSYWSSREIKLPESLFTGHKANEGADVPAMAPLRPGIRFNDQYYIQSVSLAGSTMRLTWSKQLKKLY